MVNAAAPLDVWSATPSHPPIMSESTTTPSWMRFVALIAALAACATAQWYIYHKQHWDEATPAVVLGAIAAALLLGKPRDDRSVTLTTAASTARLGRVGLVIGAAGVGILYWGVYLLATDWQDSFGTGALLLLAGVAIWCIGLAVAEGTPPPPVNAVPWVRWELVAFLAIVAVGFFLRFYRYAEFPPPGGFCAVEEPQSGQAAYNILTRDSRPWEFVIDRWMGVLGFTLYGMSPTGLRLPFMFVSALTIIPFYLLVRELVSRPAALLATALFASCRWHLFYARLAHNIFPTTCIVVVLLWLCVRVHKRGGLAAYPLIGFLSALTLYSYAGYRGTSLFVGLFLFISLVIHVRRWRRATDPEARLVAAGILRQQLAGFSLAAVAAAALLIVLGAQLRNNPTFFFEAMVRATDDSTYYSTDPNVVINQRINRIKDTLAMFSHRGDDSETFNLPNTPMLDPVSGVLLAIAVVYCVVWGKHRLQGFYALMFLVLLVMGTIFVHNFDIRRLQGIIPLIFVLEAYLADRLGQVFSGRLGRGGRPVAAVLGVAAVGLAFADNFNVYVRRAMNDPIVLRTFMNVYTLPIRYLHTLPDNAYFMLVSDQTNFFTPSDYEWWRGTRVPGSVTSDLLPVLNGERGPWTGRDLRVLIANPFEHEALVRLLQARFPGTECTGMKDTDIAPHLRFTACKVPPASAPMRFESGVHARYFYGDAAQPFLERTEPAIAYFLLPDVCRDPVAVGKPPCRVEWEGTWNVPRAGRYVLTPDGRNADVSLTVDGQPARGPTELAAGPHTLRMTARFRSINDIGAHLLVGDATASQRDILRFTTIEPDASRPPGASPAAPPPS
jgi:hypothetical protein